MAADRSLLVRLRAEVGSFVAGMKQSSQAADEVAKSAEGISPKTDKASTALGRLETHAQKNATAYRAAGGALLAFGAGTTALGVAALKTGIAYNTLQQTSRAALTTLLGGATAANAQMDKLDAFARNSPFSKEVFIKAQQQLLGFGVAADDVVPTLDAVQNAVAAFGGSSEDISPVVDVLARVQSQGRLSGDALERLGYYGVDAASIIGEQMGLTGAQIKDMASKPGGIPVDQVWDPLVNGLQEKFGGAADNVKNTFAGSIDRVRAAWRDFSGELAAPIVNPKGGGFGIDVLNGLADMMRGFQALPGPAKSTISVLTAVTGVAALAAGGFLLMAPRIAETRTALAGMSSTTQGVVGGLGKLARAAGIAVAAIVALRAVGELLDFDESGSVADYTGEIISLGDAYEKSAGKIDGLISNSRGLASMKDGMSGLGAAIKEADPGALNEKFGSLFGLIKMNPYQDAKDDVAAYDEALAGLVARGATDEAAEGFRLFAEAGKESGKSLEDVREMLPGYASALKETSNDQQLAGDSASKLGGDLANLSPEAAAAAEAMKKMKQATVDSAMSFIDFSAGMDKANFSTTKWIDGLEKMAAAQANWADNLIQATGRGVEQGVIAEFEKMGPAGAKALDDLVNGSQANIDRLNAVFDQAGAGASDLADILHDVPPAVFTQFTALGVNPTIDAVMAIQRKYNLTPEQVSTLMKANDVASPKIQKVLYRMAGLNHTTASPRISVSTAAALAAIAGVQRRISDVHGKTVAIHIQSSYGGGRTTRDALGSIHRAYANGGIEDHSANIYQATPGNAVRFFAEPETKGEAYIPLANDHRRGRALQIWEETGRLLGAKAFASGAVAGYVPTSQRFASGAGSSALATQHSTAATPSFSLVGARAKLVGPDLVEFVDGRVEATLSRAQRFESAQSRTRR